MDTRFHCVYLLTSLDPQCKDDYYVGYTVNPLRRLRQHNGELVNGARRTSRRGRPWTIVCCVSGFTEDRAALKFEWCWQNPTVSARLKHTVGVLKGLRRLPYAVGTLHLLVRAPLFNQLDLTLHVFEPELLGEAKARVEVFLAMRKGPSLSQGLAVSQQQQQRQMQGSPSEQQDSNTMVTTQVLNVTSAYGSATAAATATPLLPPLEPSSLFHIEVTTRQAFEDRHLSHDRCLLLPSAGLGGMGDLNHSSVRAGDGDNEDSCLSASCPYDVSVLSQAARAEWSNASFDGNEGGDGDTGDEARSASRRGGDEGSSRTPSPRRVGLRDGTPEMLLGYRSEERDDDDIVAQGSRCASRSASASPSAPLSPRQAVVPGGDRSGSPAPSPLPPLSSAAGNAEAHEGARPRIPLRFAHYHESDFANMHAEEQFRLHHGLLACTLCTLPLRPPCVLRCTRAPFCELRCHLSCLAMWMLHAEEGEEGEHAAPTGEAGDASGTTSPPFRRLIPSQPCPCPMCGVPLQWGVVVKELKRRVVVEERVQAAQRRTRIEQRWQTRLAQLNSNQAGAQRRKLQRKQQATSTQERDHDAFGNVTPSPLPPAKTGNTVSTPGIETLKICSDAQPKSADLSSRPTTEKAGEASVLSTVTPGDSSLLSWTAFDEDDWLL